MLNFRALGIKLGETLKDELTIMEVNKRASEIFNFAISLHPDEQITTPSSQMIYDWVKSLSEQQSLDEEKKLALLRDFINSLTPEDSPLRKLIEEAEQLPSYDLWSLIHERIIEAAKGKFKHGYYVDAVESAFLSVNKRVSEIVRERTGESLLNEQLMERAFNEEKPVIVIDNISSKDGKHVQMGYRELFLGGIIGAKNKKNLVCLALATKEAIHFIFLASFLMFKLDEAKY